MYCPTCFNDTLRLASSGVVKLSFNGKSRNTSLFTFNVLKEDMETIYKKLRERIVEYFEWYNTFQNKEPIKKLEVYCSDVVCSNKCKINIYQSRISVIDVLFDKKRVFEILIEEAKKYNIKIEVTEKDVH